MNTLARRVLMVGATALFAGCGGLQLGAPGTMPQTLTNETRAERSGSGMLPKAKRDDLLYAVGDELSVFSYPKGTLLARVANGGGSNACSDRQGNVFVTASGDKIDEYAHGDTSPFATLSDSDSPFSCSLDPTTGNLAVTNNLGSQPGDIAIYPNAQGNPETYSDPEIFYYAFCGYDNKGNLFVEGQNARGDFQFAELSSGSSSFTNISLNKKIGLGAVQWDGKYITLADRASRAIYRVEISGSAGTVVGTTRLSQWRPHAFVQSWIQGHTVIAPDGPVSKMIGFWAYPNGGSPNKTLRGNGKDHFGGVTVSVASR